MFDIGDSIFTVVPEEQHIYKRGKTYKSTHDPKIAPTASTFNMGQRSRDVATKDVTTMPEREASVLGIERRSRLRSRDVATKDAPTIPKGGVCIRHGAKR